MVRAGLEHATAQGRAGQLRLSTPVVSTTPISFSAVSVKL